MAKIIFSLLVMGWMALAACAGAPVPEKAAVSAPVPSPVVVAEAEPASLAKAETTSAPAPTPAPVELVWKMKRGKLNGPGKKPAPKMIGKVKNKKGNGYTVDHCSDFGDFAIFESKSTDEVGSAEIIIRRKGKSALCQEDFSGPYTNLHLREGSFAGIAGDLVVTEGADVSEGVVESQIFSLADGHEIARITHNPSEEYILRKTGGKVSATYFAKIHMKCELPTEGQKCWQRIVEENHLPKSVRMPDCTRAFKAAGKDLGEPAFVTVRARMADITKTNVEFLPGSATCAPEP